MTTTCPKPIWITAKLFECRDAMRDLFGETFPVVIKDYQEYLKKLAEHRGIAILDAALDTAKTLREGGHGGAVPLMLAAAVELIDPSTSTSPAEAIRTHETRPPSAPEDMGAEHRGLMESPSAAPGPGAPAPGLQKEMP